MGLNVFSSGTSLSIYKNGFRACMEKKLKVIRRTYSTKKQRLEATKAAEKDCKRRH